MSTRLIPTFSKSFLPSPSLRARPTLSMSSALVARINVLATVVGNDFSSAAKNTCVWNGGFMLEYAGVGLGCVVCGGVGRFIGLGGSLLYAFARGWFESAIEVLSLSEDDGAVEDDDGC